MGARPPLPARLERETLHPAVVHPVRSTEAVTDRRTPAKSRRAKANCPHHDGRGTRQRRTHEAWDDRAAPSHLGGQFDDAGYGPGGGFGFRVYHRDLS